ncbi:MAG: FtsQ-type POTRA domain-containing protein [Bacteroidetes bacterium]|nr:FtsQ-type POTRA domain-containing protein [Bacteroidota bacterium]
MGLEQQGKIGLGVLLAVVVGAVCMAHVWKTSLVVKQCVVEGNRLVASNEIVQLMGVQPGIPLFKVDLSEVQANVLNHYYVKEAIVKRNLPHTITVTVVERVPIAILNVGTLCYIDEEGIVLPSTISTKILDLPLISNVQSVEKVLLGTRVTSESLTEALQLLRLMKEMNRVLFHNISEIVLENNGDLKLITAENCVPIFIGRGNIEEKFVKLEAFWNQVLQVRGTGTVQYIDVRFSNQIVVRWDGTEFKKKTRL